MTRTNQTLDEGQNGNPKELDLANIRGEIHNQITDGNGLISRKKAKEIGDSLIPIMAASTIMKFATGVTPTPSAWTIRMMTIQADYVLYMLPRGANAPEGAIKL
jgi:hypothetical protein